VCTVNKGITNRPGVEVKVDAESPPPHRTPTHLLGD
jgi:hypothetical protein